MCVLMVQSEVGYATQVNTKPLPVWSSSKKDWSDWSMVPATTLPAQEEHAPALQEYGKSMPASSAASRMYVSSAHSIFWAPSGVSKVTVKFMMVMPLCTFCSFFVFKEEEKCFVSECLGF